MTKVISILYLENRIGETKERNQSLPLKETIGFSTKATPFRPFIAHFLGKGRKSCLLRFLLLLWQFLPVFSVIIILKTEKKSEKVCLPRGR